jgi:LPS sulfotransferase NodH
MNIRGDENLTNSEVEEMFSVVAEGQAVMVVSDDDWNVYLEMSYVDPAELNYEGI